MKNINYTELKGADLYYYFTMDHPNLEYRGLVSLLPLTGIDFDDACKILERSVEKGMKLIAVYPAVKDIDTSGMEFIGGIPDGALFLALVKKQTDR